MSRALAGWRSLTRTTPCSAAEALLALAFRDAEPHTRCMSVCFPGFDRLQPGDKVLICGRDADRVAAAKEALQEEFGKDAQVWSSLATLA